MAELTVTLVQAASSTDPAENRALLPALVPEGADLVVLPEAFARDFGSAGSDVSGDAETLDGPFVSALTEVAAARGCTVVAGMFERSDDPGRPWNTLVVVDRDGLRASYRKIHLYDSFGYQESDRLSAGETTPVVVDVAGLPVGLMTCYDLRFPELARSLVDAGAELLVVPAAWVAGPGKVRHWTTLAAARAIENTVYVAAAGQPGPRYTGHSVLLGPDGAVVGEAGETAAAVTGTVSRERVAEVRGTNPSLANRRM
jgi:predicted amidohydrolase